MGNRSAGVANSFIVVSVWVLAGAALGYWLSTSNEAASGRALRKSIRTHRCRTRQPLLGKIAFTETFMPAYASLVKDVAPSRPVYVAILRPRSRNRRSRLFPQSKVSTTGPLRIFGRPQPHTPVTTTRARDAAPQRKRASRWAAPRAAKQFPDISHPGDRLHPEKFRLRLAGISVAREADGSR